MSNWQPTEQGLSDLLQLLREALNPTDSHVVQEIPDYNSYLAFILTQMPQEDQYVRSVAGLTLKNNIRAHFPALPAQVIEYIKECCLQHIGDPDIGKAVGIVIAAIVERGQIQNWTQALQVLMQKLDDPNTVVIENAFTTLQKICEDCSRDLDTVVQGIQPLEFMIPKFISFFNHPSDKLRLCAINSTSQFITLRSVPLMNNMDAFLAALFSRATDDNLDVRKAVCQALVSLLEMCPTVLFPHLPNIVNYMLFCTQSDDSDLALEACEFWLVFSEQDDLREQLQPFLPRVVPVLLKCMVYSELDLLTLGGEEDDAHVADSEQDIKPRFHKANLIEIERTNKDDLDEGGKKKEKEEDEDDEEDEDYDDDDDDDFDDDLYGDWTLRKCSAAALDVLCTAFEGEVINILMPLLKVELESSDWLHRECGILALGAAAEGGMKEIAPHLPELVPYLFTNLSDTKANNNKRVQEAACSSFSLLEEEVTKGLVPYLHPILSTLATAFDKYQHRNLLLLYDTVGTLADVVMDALNQPQFIEIIMPPLTKKWQQIPDDSTDLFPLLECLSSITTALGKGFKPFAEPVYVRCVNLVIKTIEECRLAANDPAREMPDKDFMIVALDLLSGIIQALNTDAEHLVANTNPPVVQFLSICIQDEVPEVRQSAYAVLGDLAISCFEQIRPVVPHLMPLVVSQIDPQAEHVSVCNNATWAAGEIAIKWGREIQPYVEQMLHRLFMLIVNPQIQRTLLENVAITVGRLGLIFPEIVSPHLETFIHPWLMALIPIRSNDEKASAFSGLCEMIKANPGGGINELPNFCNAVAAYQDTPPSLAESFGNILVGYKNMLGQQWEHAMKSVPPETRGPLHERYGI
ncbi:armadillo-type protein [Dichotomocladium elegans]|nr:armadillo-type protein [Dichotomocladium elegans]